MNRQIDVEDIIKPFWFKDLNEEATQKCYDFLNKYYYNELPLNNIAKQFVTFQSENKLGSQIYKFGFLLIF
jgi:hypothetical protein